jgi:ATP-dependent helicase/nuclease subunit A
MGLTPAQTKAVQARGNVLVVAGAGTGKTRTLVERCLDCLVNDRPVVSIDQMLVVTFTEAAAAELRQRLRARIEEQARSHPTDSRWEEQLALFETARIGTLHSFCLRLVREHFYELGLDPQLAVLPEEEARLVADETLDRVLDCHYQGDDELAAAVQDLIQVQGRGWDKRVRTLVFRLHSYARSLPDPESWLKSQLREL